MAGRKHRKGPDLRTYDPETGRQLTRRDGSPVPIKIGEPGNRYALKHGAKTATVVSEVAEQLTDELLGVRPDLRHPAFASAVAAWARAQAQCDLLAAHTDEVGLLDPDGDPLPYTTLVERAENRAERARKSLGLDPRSSAELAKVRAEAAHVQVDLTQLIGAGAEALNGRTTQTENVDISRLVSSNGPAGELES